jgi:hypothetical protein
MMGHLLHDPVNPYLRRRFHRAHASYTTSPGLRTPLSATISCRNSGTITCCCIFQLSLKTPLRMVTTRLRSSAVKVVQSHLSPMLNSFLRSFRPVWQPLKFPTENIPLIAPHQKIEEETIPDYLAARYYPVRIRDLIHNRYQVVGKLGYGTTSTVWLARDLR